MPTKQANTLTDKRLKTLLDEVTETNPQPLVMRAAFMLSFYAGLRVQEIAGLDWRINVLNDDGSFKITDYPIYDSSGEPIEDANGDVVMRGVDILWIGSNIGKYGKSRRIPLHAALKDVLMELFNEQRAALDFPTTPNVIPSAKNGASQNLTRRAHALKMRINRVYTALGLNGCTSHSGRRSFITRGATRANTVGSSLRDVQELAGHRNLVTTQAYIQTSDKHADLINVMWK